MFGGEKLENHQLKQLPKVICKRIFCKDMLKFHFGTATQRHSAEEVVWPDKKCGRDTSVTRVSLLPST